MDTVQRSQFADITELSSSQQRVSYFAALVGDLQRTLIGIVATSRNGVGPENVSHGAHEEKIAGSLRGPQCGDDQEAP